MNNLISIGKAAKQLNVSIDSLRRWDKNNRLNAIRVGPRGRRNYRQSDIDLFLRDLFALAEQWVSAKIGYIPEDDVYCQTRDDFQARLEKLQSVLKNKVSLSGISLLSAVAGEIGNNSFDHNLGNWPDIPGVFFSYDIRKNIIILADRGQGILTTLRRVKPELTTSEGALEVAFTETISGRANEARGNGLKFVRSVITENPFTLKFQTGDAYLFLKQYDKDIIVSHGQASIKGCFAIIGF
ncbi:MAG: merR-type protein [Candidatus Levybacteria bacterium]|nr:merR-type protein [Candidatus Levybacteria bacterium]